MQSRLLSRLLPSAAALSAALSPALAQPAKPAPSPAEIVAAAPAADWVDIAASDLLVMTLAPDAKGKARRIVIQLIPPPFSQSWVANVRLLAKAHWWDGTSVYRLQDNYVAQWGDPDGEDAKKAKPLPTGLQPTAESGYVTRLPADAVDSLDRPTVDPYARGNGFVQGWPVASNEPGSVWPVHCYGMVGVGRGMSPDAGNGAELYAVIGHAPRHLDRNIALIGRVLVGMEHLSSLPRGTGPLGFYETVGERVPIQSVRLASELPLGERPRLQYLSTGSESFARAAEGRANRRDPFFIVPAGGADLCNIPVPIRIRP